MEIDNKNMMTIIDENGIEKQVEILSYFTLKSNNKNYVTYTDNQEDENGNVIVSSAEVSEKEDGSIEFLGISDAGIVEEIKNVILDLAK